ncbi:hypothetical protein METHPM2_110074 [Pseudomonas sp. PM2]
MLETFLHHPDASLKQDDETVEDGHEDGGWTSVVPRLRHIRFHSDELLGRLQSRIIGWWLWTTPSK